MLSLVASGKGKGVDTKIADIFQPARRCGIWPQAQNVHRSAVTKARNKVSWEAFQSILADVVQLAYEVFPARDEYRWKGYSIWAIDGSTYTLPATDELRSEFDPDSGLEFPGKGHYPQCHVSTLYDVFRRLPIARTVAPLAKADEREHALHLLESAPAIKDAITLFDRGYPGSKLLRELSTKNRLFLVRCPSANTFPAVVAFANSRQADAVIEVKVSNTYAATLPATERAKVKPISLRALRLEHPDGSVSVLLTNLFAIRKFPYHDIVQLFLFDAEDEFAEPFANRPFNGSDLRLGFGKGSGPRENAKRNHCIANGNSHFGNVPTTGQIHDLGLDLRFAEAKRVDL